MTETRAGRAGLTQLTRSPKIPVQFTVLPWAQVVRNIDSC
jgi:hypothetical protein